MPTLDENLRTWNDTYDWGQRGDEWSRVWGGADSQWHATLWPRIHTFLPARTVLEIAPGFGRWTQFLQHHAEHLIVVDMAQKCIDACRERFGPALDYHVNDGRSLAFVPSGTVDFVFSFDSLVHAEADVIEAYLVEIARVLTPDAVAFLHHSNLAEYAGTLDQINVPDRHWRATSVSAVLFQRLAESAGLACLSQEIINWAGARLIDCLSVVTRVGSRRVRPCRVWRNPDFMAEAAWAGRLAGLYGCPDGKGDEERVIRR